MLQKNLPKITLPYSDLFAKDIDEDFLKIIGAIELKSMDRDVNFLDKDRLFHASSGLMQDSFYRELKRGKAFQYLSKMNISCFSFDMGPGVSRVSIKEKHYYPEGGILDRKGLLDFFRQRIGFIKENFKGRVFLENLNYFKTGAYEYVCEPEFISQVVEENDVFLLLDVAHAVISAFNKGVDIYDYLKRFPLERVSEVHLSRPGFINGNIEDVHDLPGDKEYKILGFLLKHSSPSYIAIEYYKDKPLLLHSYRDLKERLDNYNIL